MKDIENTKKESPMLGLTGMGGGVASLMWAGASQTLYDIFVFGDNNSNLGTRLGLTGSTDRSSPTQLPGGWIGFYAGEVYNRKAGAARKVVDGENQFWLWGSNAYGALGNSLPSLNLNDSWAASSPVQLPGDWVQYSRGGKQSMGTKSDGTMWMWGQTYGYTFPGPPANPSFHAKISSPIQIPGTDWSTTDPFETGDCHALIAAPGQFFTIKQNGSLWVWSASGESAGGIIGLNDMANPNPTKASRSSPHQIGTDTNWKTLATTAGPGSVFAIKTDGTAWAWGNGKFGQLGLNEGGPSARKSSPTQIGYNTNWKKISGCPYGTNFGLKTDGTLWSWGGYVNYGSGGLNQGGNAPPSNRYKSSPTQIPGTNWTDVESGQYTGYGLKSDGTAWSWGKNTQGQLGLNDLTDRSSPTQIPGTWGDNGVAYGNIQGAKDQCLGLKKKQ